MRTLRTLLVMCFAVSMAFAQQPKRFTISANGGCATVTAQNNSTVGILVSGTWVGTLTPNLQIAGVSGAPTAAMSVTPTNSTTSQTTITANGGFRAGVNGFATFNLCATAWTSGSAIVDLFSTQADSSLAGASGGGGGGSVTQGTSPWVDNVTQFGSSNVATGAGAGGAGIPRVTVSNDSSLAANQSVNVNQFGGSATATGAGAGGAGIPRVTVSNDSSLAANQSVNVNQFGGSAAATGAGASGAGVPRVTVANDSTATATPLVVRQSDGTNSATAAFSAWGTAPTGTQVQGVNSDVFIGGTIAGNSAAGVQKVGVVGGASAASVDAPMATGTSPINGFGIIETYRNAAPAPTSNQTVGIQADSGGSLFVHNFRRSQTVCQPTTIASSSAATTIITAQAASTFADITNLIVTVTPAATTDLAFTATLTDGTNSFIYDMDTGALATATADPVGVNINFNPAMPATTAATAWTLQLSSASVTVHITACFVKGLAN